MGLTLSFPASAQDAAKDIIEAEVIEDVFSNNDAPAVPEKAEPVKTTKETMDMPRVTSTSADDSVAPAPEFPILRLTQDKSEMITLKQEAASVVVGNPNHISVLLDTPNTLVIVPRAAGASHFSVTGKDGSIIMQRHVIVGAPKEKYVRIRRSCNAGQGNCEEMSTYFCPDTCHEVVESTGRSRLRR